MDTLTTGARRLLDRLEPDRCYEPSDLHPLAPEASNEYLQDVMHELWVNRHVERAGYAGWRLQRSSTGHEAPPDAPTGRAGTVKPEDLFDHTAFGGFFK